MSIEIASDLREPSDERLIGAVLANRYQIEVRLGEGAMGAVYKARHVKVGRPFAVKVLHRRLLQDHKVAQRFEREAELAGRLRHPNVVGVVDVGETGDGLRYMVMDFAEGDDLATLLSEAPMPPARIVNLTRQMLEGLYHAHEAGLIHRDFKPENVIVELDDHGVEVPRIVDFGIAILREGGDSTSASGRITTNGLVLGTPHYMAPEQAVADPIDHRIDLFALGIVIYELLCGKLPFDGSGAEIARANLLLDPPAISARVPYLEVDPLLEAFARRLMAKKRDHRPANAKIARELLDLIDRDPAAAAAALGVPSGTSRLPAVTQDVAPRPRSPSPHGDDVHYLAHAQAQAAAGPLVQAALMEAPPVRPVSAPFATPSGPFPQHDLRTDHTFPLPFDGEVARRRRRLLTIAGSAIGATAILLALAIGLGGEQPQPAAGEPVAGDQAAGEPVATSAPAPARDDVPAAQAGDPPAQPAPVVPPAHVVPAAVTPPAPRAGDEAAVAAPSRPPRPRPPAVTRPRQPAGPPAQVKPPPPDEAAPPSSAVRPRDPPTAVPDPPRATPPGASQPKEITAASVERYYNVVNGKLAQLVRKRNDAEANRLADRIRLVKLSQVDPASLAKWMTALAELDREATAALARAD